jgi:hypothetical protein
MTGASVATKRAATEVAFDLPRVLGGVRQVNEIVLFIERHVGVDPAAGSGGARRMSAP